MKVIFLNDVPRVGKRHEVKEVSDGYAANFLLPRGLAEQATQKRLEELKTSIAARKSEREVEKELLHKNFEALKNVRITLSSKANEQGHLFKGIHKEELAEALLEQTHISLPSDALVLEHPLKSLGEHVVPVSIEGKRSSFQAVIERA